MQRLSRRRLRRPASFEWPTPIRAPRQRSSSTDGYAGNCRRELRANRSVQHTMTFRAEPECAQAPNWRCLIAGASMRACTWRLHLHLALLQLGGSLQSRCPASSPTVRLVLRPPACRPTATPGIRTMTRAAGGGRHSGSAAPAPTAAAAAAVESLLSSFAHALPKLVVFDLGGHGNGFAWGTWAVGEVLQRLRSTSGKFAYCAQAGPLARSRPLALAPPASSSPAPSQTIRSGRSGAKCTASATTRRCTLTCRPS